VAAVVSLGLDLQSRLTRAAEEELRAVRRFIDTTSLSEGGDRRSIDSPSAPSFSSRAAYRALSPARPVDSAACLTWSLKIPTKVKIFAYLLDIDRLSTRVNLFHKGCASSSACAACGAPETGRHLFFDCPRAAELWAALDVPIPVGSFSIWDLQGPSQTSTCTWQFGLATVLWSIWKSRNDFIFNGVAHSTASTLRRACDDLSLWRWRLRPSDREPLDRLRSHILTRAVA
jgi:hypothetical protein